MVTSRSTDIGAPDLGRRAHRHPAVQRRRREPPARLCAGAAELFGADPAGMTATFTVPEYPGRSFTATLTAAAGAVGVQSAPSSSSSWSTTAPTP
ncbi:MAG: hypothetical protein WDM92_10365 [Caulobacteraceae bacterium]